MGALSELVTDSCELMPMSCFSKLIQAYVLLERELTSTNELDKTNKFAILAAHIIEWNDQLSR